MIEQVEIRTQFGKTLVLPLRSSKNGLHVMELDGLDPTKSNIVTTSFARRDGTVQQASRRESRFPKIKLGFDPSYDNQTVDSLRQELFRIFMTKTNVELRYITESGLSVKIFGEVETFESPRMSQDPDATITVYCFDPDFQSLLPKQVEDTTVHDDSIGILDYNGTVETGFKFRLAADRETNGFIFTNITDDGKAHILEFRAPLIAGDVLEISTVVGEKGAWRTRAGNRISVLQGISPFSDYVNLWPGANRLNVQTEGAPIPFTIEYSDKYGAI